MSSGQPPPPPPPSGPGGTYPPPPGAVPPYGAPPPGKPRPRARSWIAAVLMIVVGIAVGVLLIARTVLAFTEIDTTVEADDQPHAVTVPTDEDRMVWQRQGQQAACDIVDTETGQPVASEPLGASFTKSGGTGSWVGAYRFDPGSGDLEVTCAASGGDVQLAPAAEFGSFFGGLALGIVVPLVLVGAGLVWLIVLTVLTITRRKPA